MKWFGFAVIAIILTTLVAVFGDDGGPVVEFCEQAVTEQVSDQGDARFLSYSDNTDDGTAVGDFNVTSTEGTTHQKYYCETSGPDDDLTLDSLDIFYRD